MEFSPRFVFSHTNCSVYGKYLKVCSRHFKQSDYTFAGLSNSLLDEQRVFNETVCNMIISFIMGEPQPVCLLAHGGYGHDFRFLQAQIKMNGKELPDSVFCSDTIDLFKELKVFDESSSKLMMFNEKDVDEWFELNSEKLEFITEGEEAKSRHNQEVGNPREIDAEHVVQLTKKQVAPLSDGDVPLPNETGRNSLDSYYGSTPIKMKRSESHSIRSHKANPPTNKPYQVTSARRELFPTTVEISSLIPKYTLSNVYKRLFKRNISKAHTAEGDVIALLECVSVVREYFFKWVTNNNQKLSNIKKLW